MLELERVRSYKTIQEGDLLLVEPKNKTDPVIHVKCQSVIEKLDGDEEIILVKKSNKYFIMSMYLRGQSWVENVFIVVKQTKGEKR